MRKINIPVFVSHQGCPNNCIFCDQKKITGVREKREYQAVREHIRASLETAPGECEIEIAFFGGSFTGIPSDEQNGYLETAGEFLSDKRVKGIRLSTRPDYITEEILENLKRHKVKSVELGVQSMDDEVLFLNKRNMKSSSAETAAGLIKKSGIELGLQMMTGLYGSNREKDILTAERIIALKPATVRIYPTVAIEGTELYSLWEKGEYKPYSLEETVDLCAVLYEKFEEKGIRVIRTGLMSSSEITPEKVVGPYHPAFGELVSSRRYYLKIKEKLVADNIKGDCLFITVPKGKISQATGNKKSNVLKLKEEFGFKEVRITEGDAFGIRVV